MNQYNNLSNDELRQLMDDEARISEAAAYDDSDADSPLPDHVTVIRPNRVRSKVLQVRLNPDEFEAIEAIADRRDLPVSTVARDQLLALIRQDRAPGSPYFDLPDALDRASTLLHELSQRTAAALQDRYDTA